MANDPNLLPDTGALSYYATFDGEGQPTAFYHEAQHGPKLKPIQVYIEGETLRDLPTVQWEMVPNPDCRIPADAVKISDAQWSAFVGADAPV